ncbi:MAG TPA: hypothetical protein VEH76_13050 [Methylocystis sp.]|nr:hypothetical protein [Methylocystis sp.]
MPAEKLLRRSIAALACAAALAAAASPSSAMTLAAPAAPQAGPQVEKVWCGWGGCGWGWGPAAVVGGLVAGTAIGAAAAASSPYYYNGYYAAPAYYGPGPYYPRSCLRRWVDYYGYPHWRRVC